MFEIEFTAEAETWILSLNDTDFDRMAAALDMLQEGGPALGRPIVDTVKQSRHKNMKELRSVGGHLRALFAFDPNRNAIVLIGGNKQNNWKGWYAENIPVADRLYDRHLGELGKTA